MFYLWIIQLLTKHVNREDIIRQGHENIGHNIGSQHQDVFLKITADSINDL